MSAKRRFLALVFVTALAASCGSSVSPSPPPSPAPSAPVDGRPITFQMYDMPTLSGADVTPFAPPHLIAVSMVNAGLYRYDASLAPVPDLAAEPCDVAADQVTITCALRPATFHDGSPVTAEDIAFSFEIAKSPECPFSSCWAGALARVEALDARTVRFTLARPYAPFLSAGLGDTFVLPRKLIEDAYAAYASTARRANPAHLREVQDQVLQGLRTAQPECVSSLAGAESALREAGVGPADRRLFLVFRGTAFDACAYADYLQRSLGAVARSLDADGIDAIAAAYSVLPFSSDNSKLIGAGPFRVREADPVTGLVLERYAGYHHGMPVTPEIRIRLMRDEAAIDAGIADGSIDWRIIPPWEDIPEAQTYASIRLTKQPANIYRAIQYNVRPGRLFADRNLRQAVDLCIDKERTVVAATDRAIPIYSPIPPNSWAYQPGLAKPRDVHAGRALIEASGWQMGADGIYEKDGRRLSAEVVIRVDFVQPIAFLDRAALQVRDCGIELKTRLAEFRDILEMIDVYPHIAPGTSQPFDAYLGGWGIPFDPDQFDTFHSSRVTTESRSGGPNLNYIGFTNANVDRLLEQGVSTYDLDERSRIYRELQRLLAEELPYEFLWAETNPEALDSDLTSVGAPLDFASYHWWWQLEALLNPAE